MKCDRRLLSDYLDGELPNDLDREVGEHLLTCESCRQIVQEYRGLGRELRLMPRQPVPATVEARIRERLAERRPSPLAAFFGSLVARPLVPALGTLAATLLIAFAVIFQQLRAAEPEVVAAYAQDGGIDVVFDRSVSASTAEWVVMIDPPASVTAEVIGNKVVLRPEQPLQPNTNYVVVIEQRKATSGVAAIAPQQPPVTINFSTSTEIASVSPTSSPTAKPSSTAVPTAVKTPTSVAIVAVAPATPTTPSRPTPTVVPLPPTAIAKASASVPLEACVNDVSPSIARLLRDFPDAERRLVCAVKPARTPTVTQQTFADGIFISLGRDEAYVLSTGPNPGDQTWTSYGSKANSRASSPTAAPATGTPAATPSPQVAGTQVGGTQVAGTQVAGTQLPETPVTVSAASSATTPAVASTPAATPTVSSTPPPTLAPAATPTPGTTPSPATTPKPAPSPSATSGTATPTSIPAGKEVRRVLGDPSDVEDALGAPTSAEVSQPAVVQELAGGTVISYRGEEGYVLLADGHWERVAPTSSPEATREPTVSPTAVSPTPTAKRPAAATATTPATPAILTPAPTRTPGK